MTAPKRPAAKEAVPEESNEPAELLSSDSDFDGGGVETAAEEGDLTASMLEADGFDAPLFEELPDPAAPPDEPVPVGETVVGPIPLVLVRFTRNEQSVPVGGAHYTARAGSTLKVTSAVAEELIARGLAERV